MKIKSYKKLKNNTYQITFLDSDISISLYDDVILKHNLLMKKEISQKELEEIQIENQNLSCFYLSLKYISFKNRSKGEIRKYLKQQKFEDKIIEKTIKMLEEQKIINDQEYLKMFVHDQFHLTKNGPKKIELKLIKLGFKEEEIKDVLAEFSKEEWETRLKSSIEKKIKTYKKESTAKIKEKILYAFLNEGYQKEDINSVLESIALPKNTDALKKEALKLFKRLSIKYQNQDLFYQIKGSLLNKGFSYEEIDTVLEDIKKTSNNE